MFITDDMTHEDIFLHYGQYNNTYEFFFLCNKGIIEIIRKERYHKQKILLYAKIL